MDTTFNILAAFTGLITVPVLIVLEWLNERMREANVENESGELPENRRDESQNSHEKEDDKELDNAPEENGNTDAAC